MGMLPTLVYNTSRDLNSIGDFMIRSHEMLIPPDQWWAPLTGLAYFLGCLYFKETFPFSLYGMYAGTATRKEGAVPVFLADGEIDRVERYSDFAGIDPHKPEGIHPLGLPDCSLEWQVHEMRRWIREHMAPAGAARGPVRVQVAYRILSVDGSGRLSETLRVVAEGTASPL